MRRDKSGSMKYDDRPGAPAANGRWLGDQDQVSAYLYRYDTIWLPTDLLRHERREALTTALVAASCKMAVQLHFNKGLAGAAPDGGSYLSESDDFNRDWRRAFWGDNDSRLRDVKAKYDPDGLFFVYNGVGSEGWSADGFERRA
jgi:hypothetical protein